MNRMKLWHQILFLTKAREIPKRKMLGVICSCMRGLQNLTSIAIRPHILLVSDFKLNIINFVSKQNRFAVVQFYNHTFDFDCTSLYSITVIITLSKSRHDHYE